MNINNIDRIIYKNILDKKPIDNLIDLGLDYYFLVKRYEKMINNHEVIIRGNDFILTKKGKNRLIKLEKYMFGSKIIEPLNAYRINKMSIEDIFLPKKQPIA